MPQVSDSVDTSRDQACHRLPASNAPAGQPATSPEILLVSLNARYTHASLALRYLYANLGSLRHLAVIREFTITANPRQVVEELLQLRPRIIGFGIYIWNRRQTLDILRMLRVIAPEIRIIAGGPEITHDPASTDYAGLIDHCITGPSDVAFRQCCQQILAGRDLPAVVSAPPVPLSSLASPYPFYTDEDLLNRTIYVEASRGCPFRCEFCLSSLDTNTVAFELAPFLDDMQRLIDRGARQFKFVDRTFNLKSDTCVKILAFFLDRIDLGLFLHFEMIPDRLPEPVKALLPLFPAGSIQLEIGIQSFNPAVQAAISRRQNNARTVDNLNWLRQYTHAHIHADLIIGLPTEDLDSIAAGFDKLVGLEVAEIQVGLLKLLPGTPLHRHVELHDMRFSPDPPYQILSHRLLDFPTICRLERFARYWDMVANAGHCPALLPLLLDQQPFDRFMAFSDWLWQSTGQTRHIATPRLHRLVRQAIPLLPGHDNARLTEAVLDEAFLHDKACLSRHERRTRNPLSKGAAPDSAAADRFRSRQLRHLQPTSPEV